MNRKESNNKKYSGMKVRAKKKKKIRQGMNRIPIMNKKRQQQAWKNISERGDGKSASRAGG